MEVVDELSVEGEAKVMSEIFSPLQSGGKDGLFCATEVSGSEMSYLSPTYLVYTQGLSFVGLEEKFFLFLRCQGDRGRVRALWLLGRSRELTCLTRRSESCQDQEQ